MRTRGDPARFARGFYPHLGSADGAVGSGTLRVADNQPRKLAFVLSGQEKLAVGLKSCRTCTI